MTPVDDAATAAPRPIHAERLAARPLDVRAALLRFRAAATAAGIGAADVNRAESALAEVLNNIAEHAYDADHEGPIDVCIRREGAALAMRTRDQGAPMPGERPPAPAPTPQPQRLREGGYGWPMIYALCPSVTYMRDGAANVLEVKIPLETQG